MDLTDGTSTFASAEQRVLLRGLGCPTESAFAFGVFVAHVMHRSWHLDKLFKVFLVRVRKYGVCAVALLLFGWLINLHLISLADFFDCKLYPANF